MSENVPLQARRTFLKVAAGALAASTAAGCSLESHPPETGPAAADLERETGFDRTLLDAVGEVILPAELGSKGRDVAIGAFVAWADGYEPVAEEMHGYGYADIRYLPPDPAPAWRAQLAALDLLARKSTQRPFARLDVTARRGLLTTALKGHGSDRLPAPLDATHIAIALLAHWASSPDAADLAWGAMVTPSSCRVLSDANTKPLPITGLRA
jgi:Gluconate 2-dehydrogenase subunit 3